MYILHQNSRWPYRHKHINIMMNEYTPVSVYTCTQDFPNSFPNRSLFCYHFSTALVLSSFLSLCLYTSTWNYLQWEKVRNDASSCDISNPAPFFSKYIWVLYPRRVHDPFWLLHTRGLRKMRSHNLWRIIPPDSRVASTTPPSIFSWEHKESEDQRWSREVCIKKIPFGRIIISLAYK